LKTQQGNIARHLHQHPRSFSRLALTWAQCGRSALKKKKMCEAEKEREREVIAKIELGHGMSMGRSQLVGSGGSARDTWRHSNRKLN
jgi:hypothetical protein